MRNTRDSFLHFLADNLDGIPVHNIRRDPNKPDADKIQVNAVNVHFLDVAPDTQVGNTTVVIDVINDDELTALSWVNQVWTLLSSAFFTPKLDYSNPESPVSTGTNIMWDRHKVRFRVIVSDFYYHHSCVLTLQHTVS